MPEVNPKKAFKLAALGATGLVAVSAIFGSAYTVGETERGLVYTFGKLSAESATDVKQQGLHFKLPFVQSIRKMPVGIQERVIDKVNIYSKDSQDFDARIQYVYQIPESSLIDIARKLPSNDQIDSIVENNVLQALKGSMGKREATDIPSTRNEAIAEAKNDANKQVTAAIGIGVNSMTMPNFEWNPAFKTAIGRLSEMKADAKRAEEAVAKTKAEADSVAAKAKGEAEATKAAADAEAYSKKAQADANLYSMSKAAEGETKIIGSIGRENLSNYWFKETWDGKLPVAVGGSNVNLNSMEAVAAAAGRKPAAAPAP
jgi:membrane protease subunit HflC